MFNNAINNLGQMIDPKEYFSSKGQEWRLTDKYHSSLELSGDDGVLVEGSDVFLVPITKKPHIVFHKGW